MIFKEHKEIVGVFKGETPISAIYKGIRLVWQAIRSCFGSGAWINERPWIGEDPWKNTN